MYVVSLLPASSSDSLRSRLCPISYLAPSPAFPSGLGKLESCFSEFIVTFTLYPCHLSATRRNVSMLIREQIARVVAFLASRDSEWINGMFPLLLSSQSMVLTSQRPSSTSQRRLRGVERCCGRAWGGCPAELMLWLTSQHLCQPCWSKHP